MASASNALGSIAAKLAATARSVPAMPAVRWFACLGLCAAYIQGPVTKILDFDNAAAEMKHFGLSPASTFAVAVIAFELAASMMILVGRWRWLAAWGPFPDGDGRGAILTGMTLVCAMAIQNGAHRVHLPKAPPSTPMTGTTTQIMLDLADLLSGMPSPQHRAEMGGRLRKMIPNVVAFAAGCGAAALIFIGFGLRAFLLPPVVAIAAVIVIHLTGDPEIA